MCSMACTQLSSVRPVVGLEQYHRADALAFVHQVEGPVDVLQGHGVGDHAVEFDLTVQVVVHVAGQLAAALDAAEGGALPGAAGDQLERAGGDFLAGARDADDGGHAPAHVAALQRLAHDVHVADALEGIVDAAVGHVHYRLGHAAVEVFGVDEIGGTQRPGHDELVRVGVDGDDAPGLGHDRALDHRQPDAAQTEHGDAWRPASTLAVLSTAPMPVVTPQPSRQTLSSGAAGLILARAISGTTVYSEKVEQPM